jgi:hypothetical protein
MSDFVERRWAPREVKPPSRLNTGNTTFASASYFTIVNVPIRRWVLACFDRSSHFALESSTGQTILFCGDRILPSQHQSRQ